MLYPEFVGVHADGKMDAIAAEALGDELFRKAGRGFVAGFIAVVRNGNSLRPTAFQCLEYFKGATQWPFQLFYWDYSAGILFTSLLLASSLVLPVFNFANILLVMAIAVAGMAIAFPVGIGLALIIGVLTNLSRYTHR